MCLVCICSFCNGNEVCVIEYGGDVVGVEEFGS